MGIIISKVDQKPAILFEKIACIAFNEDPEQIVDTGFFNFNFVPCLTEEGLQSMYSIIDQLAKNQKSVRKKNDYYALRNSLKIGMDPDSSIKILSYLAKS